MYVADTLSRAPLPEVNACSFSTNLETVDHASMLAINDDHVQQIKHASVDDPVFQVLRRTIVDGWPDNKDKLPDCLRAYYDFRDELTVQDQLVFKGQRLVVPASLHREMMAAVHASHIGIEGCIRRARETLYWSRMSADLKEYISKCDVCLAHRAEPGKEPLLQHEIIE